MFIKKIFSKITVIVEVVSVLIIVYLIIQFNLKTRNNIRESMSMNNNNFDNNDDIIKEIKNMGLEPALGFCEKYRSSGKKREEACSKLTKNNCSKVSCCTWNNNVCVAGNKFGPLFTTKGGVKISEENKYF